MGRAAKGTWSVLPIGYRVHHRRGHVVAGPDGRIYEHRLVLFEKIGEGPHRCHWCGVHVNWRVWDRKSSRLGQLVVDHLDHDRLNNEPSNLVPSCSPCNAWRRKAQPAR